MSSRGRIAELVTIPQEMTPPSQAVDRSERTLELARMYRARRALVQQHLRGFGVPEAALEDALHDVFMIAFRRLAVFDTRRGSMRAWLVGIAWRVAAAHRRRREHVALPCDEDVASDLPDPEAYAARSEAAVVLDRLLNSLPPEQAAAFVLAELEGLQCREIAEQWNIAPATAYTRVARARVKLRAELERARQGRRPWWAVLFVPARESSGFTLAAAFVSVRMLIGIVAALVVLGGAWWWLSGETHGRASTVTDAPPIATDTQTADRFVRTSADGGSEFGPRGERASIAGKVHAVSGAVIAGAEVCAWPEVSEHGTPTPTCTRSSASGNYRIVGIPPSRYRMAASARGFAPGEAAATTARGTSSLTLHAGEERKGIDIALIPGGVELRGVVSDVFGGVVEGARIIIRQHSHQPRIEGRNSGPVVPVHATTAADGTFVTWVARGDLELDAVAEGYGHASTRMRAPGPTVSISLLPESTLSGIVVDRATRAPVAGARVVLRSWSETNSTEETATFSDDDGRFEIEGLVPGRYRPVAYADGLHGESATSHVLELGESKDDIVIEMIAAASLHAKVVVAPKRTPCPSGSVMLWDHRAEIVRTAVISPGGIVEFPALVPGEYGIAVSCDDHDSSTVPTQVAVADGEATEVVWTVEQGKAIHGHVLDARGRPIAGQVIAIPASAGPDGAPRWAAIGTDGRYALQGLAPGEYSLSVDSDGPDLEVRTTIIDRDVVVDFDAAPTARLVGTVVRGGKPAPGVTVIAAPGELWTENRTFATDDGSFSFETLAPGRYAVKARDDLGNESAVQRVVLSANRDADAIAIAMPEPLAIRGVVLDEDGGALRDALVSARATSSMTTEASRRAEIRAAKAGGPGTTLTDARGAFVLSGVAAGETYTVLAQRRGGGSATRDGVRAGDHARLEMTAAATVRGTVRAQSGPSAMWVEMYADGGLVHRESFVLDSGSFEIDDIDPGEYDLRVIAPEGRGKVRVVAKAGASTKVELELVPNRTIRGRFVDLETSEPLAGVWALTTEQGVSPQRIAIAAERAIQTRTPGLLTGPDGVFTARDVPPTTVTLLALSAGFQYEALDDVMEAMLVPQSQDEGGIIDFPIAKQRLPWAAVPADLGFELRQVPLACDQTPTVTKISDPTIAKGLAVGDEIITVDGHDVTDLRCFLVRALMRVPEGTTLEFGLKRGETVRVTARAP